MVADRLKSSRARPAKKGLALDQRRQDGFEIEPAERAVAGTTVLLHFNEEGKQYANSWRCRRS
jgi:molecular chaperone HtpG